MKNLNYYLFFSVLMVLLYCSISCLADPGNNTTPDFIHSNQVDSKLLNDIRPILPPENYTYYPDGPLWDGYNEKPAPNLVYNVSKKLLYSALEAQGYSKSAIQVKATALLPPPPNWQGGLASKGTVQAPVILLSFPDQNPVAGQTSSDISEKFFGLGSPALYPYESVHRYYNRSSMGMLSIQGDVSDWVQSSTNKSQWNASFRSAQTVQEQAIIASSLIKDACQKADSQLDFSKYDNDNDGYIDVVYVKYAGPHDGWSDLFWAFMWSNVLDYQLDGKKVRQYVFSWYSSPDYDSTYPLYNPHTDIHETGHILGLPDYYDYDTNVGPKGGVGGWDMMDANFGEHNAFSKYLLDWTTPEIIASGQKTVVLPPISENNKTVLIMPNASLNSYSEFYMVNYKEGGVRNEPSTVWSKGYSYPQVPFDTKGLFIWHVDARLNQAKTDFEYDNSYTSHKLLRLMEADGKEEIEQSARGGYFDQADIYVPGKSIGPVTTPNSNTYAGVSTDVHIDSISQTLSGMSADYYFTILSPMVTSISPTSGQVGTNVTFTVTGNNFIDGAMVNLTHAGQINISSIGLLSGINLTGMFSLPPGAVTGLWNVSVNQNSLFSNDNVQFSITGSPALVANFTANQTTGSVPLSIQFTDLSTGNPISWQWDFGDGGTSSVQHPVYTYSVAGVYTVNLTASNAGSSDVRSVPDLINATSSPALPPVANFTVNQPIGPSPLTVQFTDFSSGNPTSWVWDFGDGVTATEQHPINTYSVPGLYTVNLTASNACGSDTLSVPDLINVTSSPITPPVANFTANQTAGPAPLTVQFTDLSIGNPTYWLWIFGDGITSTVQHPVHTYSVPGNYSVVFTAINPGGGDQLRISDYISVTGQQFYSITASAEVGGSISPSGIISVVPGGNQSFTITPDPNYDVSSVLVDGQNLGSLRSYTFTNVVADHNISATFTRVGGEYMINATADPYTIIYPQGVITYPEGSNTTYLTQSKPGSDLMSVVVDNSTSPPDVSWTFTNISYDHNISTIGRYTPGQVQVLFMVDQTWGSAPMAVQFTDESVGEPTSFSWQFGDGSTSINQNPLHIYQTPGVYSVTLRAINSQSGGVGLWNNAVTVTEGTIPKPTPTQSPGIINAAFTATPVTGSVPVDVRFQDQSTGNPVSWSWLFGDGQVSTLQNPTHRYANPGSYSVTLIAENARFSGSVTKPGFIVVN